MTTDKPFYERETIELANTDPAIVEYQIQEGLTQFRGIAEHAVASAKEIVELRRKLREAHSNVDKTTEWWKTFRAALTGFCARSEVSFMAVTERATAAADEMHGKLE